MFTKNQVRTRVASSARRVLKQLRRASITNVMPSANRRETMVGYVVSIELGEATLVAEGGLFAFQIPATKDMEVGKRVRFTRQGDRFEQA